MTVLDYWNYEGRTYVIYVKYDTMYLRDMDSKTPLSKKGKGKNSACKEER